MLTLRRYTPIKAAVIIMLLTSGIATAMTTLRLHTDITLYLKCFHMHNNNDTSRPK